jgi:hypothetical protein
VDSRRSTRLVTFPDSDAIDIGNRDQHSVAAFDSAHLAVGYHAVQGDHRQAQRAGRFSGRQKLHRDFSRHC